MCQICTIFPRHQNCWVLQLENYNKECSNIQNEITQKEKKNCKMIGASQKLKDLLESQRSPFTNEGIRGSTCLEKFNMSHNFVKTSKA